MWGFLFKYKKQNPMANGVDVSHFQFVKWDEIQEDSNKYTFAYIKATQGVGFTDPQLKYNASKAKQFGLKTGYYHYASLSTKDIVKDSIAEADYFISVIKALPNYDLPLMLDIEDEKGYHENGLTPADVLLWINTFFGQLTKSGYTNYAIYSYTPFLNSYLPKNHGLGHLKLWIADYRGTKEPNIPHGWTEYFIWQWTDKGVVKGVSGKCDLNKTNPAHL